jgi:DNA-binding CsgD family transcriptional regulator
MMEAAFNSARRACYAGLDSVTLRREVADRVSDAIPFDAQAFSTCDPDTGLVTHTIADGVPGPLGRVYVEMLYPTALARMAMDMPRRGRNVFSMAEQSEATNAALREYGIRQQFHVSIASAGRLWGTWCLMRGSESSPSRRREYAFLARLAPHLARGLQSAALLDRGIADSESDEDSAAGVLVLDRRYCPILQTPVATRWLEDLRDIGLTLPEDVPLSILGLAREVRTRPDEGGFERHLRGRGRSGRWYSMRASLAEPDASGESAVVIVIRPALPQEIANVLTRLYALSPREREVIAAVARGEATKCIAETLKLSPHTVTEHIQRACDKIGVRGRKALIARLFFDGYAPTLKAEKPTLSDALRVERRQIAV